ncbi:MAG: sugar kinase, partial [Actinobacteria bacterium]|nr:sugar kinase [Actinomycetota bacterium]
MIVSRAPVRLSMGGGGTDLPSYYERFGGFLMAASINKYVYILVNKMFYDSIRLSYSKTEIVDHVDEIEHNIFREALKQAGVDCQVEVVSVADVPAQCGLGTSSAFTVALLNGLYAYKKRYLSLGEIAEAACHIEIDVLNEPIGKQDQYAAAYGGFNAYWFERDGSVIVEPVNIKEENLE